VDIVKTNDGVRDDIYTRFIDPNNGVYEDSITGDVGVDVVHNND
jgi:hypothetical protein